MNKKRGKINIKYIAVLFVLIMIMIFSSIGMLFGILFDNVQIGSAPNNNTTYKPAFNPAISINEYIFIFTLFVIIGLLIYLIYKRLE